MNMCINRGVRSYSETAGERNGSEHSSCIRKPLDGGGVAVLVAENHRDLSDKYPILPKR